MGDREGKKEIQRQMLPSMDGALDEDKTLAYLAPALRFRRRAAPTAFSSHWTGRPKSEYAPQHPDYSSHVLATGSPPPIPQLQMETSQTERASTNTNALQKASLQSFNAGNSPSNASISLVLGLLNYDNLVFNDPKSTSKVTSNFNKPPATHFQNESVTVTSTGLRNELLPDELRHAWQHDKRYISAISKLPCPPRPSTSCSTLVEQVTSHLSNLRMANDEQPCVRKDPTQRGAKFASHCHSCNRTETPEWRRGPGGNRTMCRACRLHYIKVYHSTSKYASE